MVSMSVAHKEELVESKSKYSVDDVINRAIKKIGAKKENELCKYLPMKSGGYMHHFTLKKMKVKQPQELAAIIEKFVVNADRPSSVAPKQRAARGSRKRRDHMNFTRNQLERMLSIARLAGDKEIITILSPKKSLSSCKRDLILAIRQNRIEQELWNCYVESIQAQQTLANSEMAHQ